MYAVILSGGKQYRVQQGETLKLESLPNDVGSTVLLNQVLAVGEGADLKIGKPFLDGAKVTVTVVSHGRGKKVEIIKFRRRKHHEKWQGHRQNFTEVKVEQIEV